ncbi:MAG: hypothetical protein AABZ14_03825 [Candidatus Margulisiibacteriota bacterium]
MIRKYSIYFAGVAGAIVFGEGLYVNVALDNLLLRTLIAFCLFFILGNLLGVITIEALLENQLQKITKQKNQNKSTES